MTFLKSSFTTMKNPTTKISREQAIRELQKIPSVGIAVANDLYKLGYLTLSDLHDADPQAMYDRLCQLQKTKVDRCMLYTFRCAVYFAKEEDPNPELLKWWSWSEQNIKKREVK